jgi:spermidine synthase
MYWLLAPSASDARDPSGGVVVHRKDTQYHRLLVIDEEEERILKFDRSRQSSMYLDDPFETSFDYPNYLHLTLALKPDARRVLIVGLGGGSLVKRMWRDYPQMEIDVVEIDPEVVDVAETYFAMPEDERIRIEVEDGRRFLQQTEKTYDIIVMDAYYADALPAHLTTVELFREAKARLAPGGVLAYNIIGSVENDKSKLFRSMYRTADTVWDRLWVFPIGIGTDGLHGVNRNIIVMASDARLTRQELLGRIENRVGGRVTVPGFEQFGADLYEEPVKIGDVPLLTDDHAPTDSLIDVN